MEIPDTKKTQNLVLRNLKDAPKKKMPKVPEIEYIDGKPKIVVDNTEFLVYCKEQ